MKIVINRSDAIGDVLLTMPMASLIKKEKPDATLVFICNKLTAPLFENNHYVDDVWVVDPKRNKLHTFHNLKKRFKSFRPDAYVYVGGTHAASAAALWSGVPFRGGLKSRWPSFICLNKGIRQSRSMVVMHEAEYNLNLLRPLGLHYDSEDRHAFGKELLNLDPDETEKISETLKEELKAAGLSQDKPFVVIHPGMSGHTLNWSSRNYARLIYRIDDAYPGKYNYIVSFTPSDRPYLAGLRDHLSNEKLSHLQDRVYFMDGTVHGLRFSMGVISMSSLFVGPSTGPTHIANALGVPQIGLYSPIKVQSARRWGPLIRKDELTKVVVPDVVCGEIKQCAGKSCPYYECMGKVEVETVFNNAVELLNKE